MKDKKYRKVKDHCHYTGEYRGAAHSICSLKYSVLKKNPIAFHNGSVISEGITKYIFTYYNLLTGQDLFPINLALSINYNM